MPGIDDADAAALEIRGVQGRHGGISGPGDCGNLRTELTDRSLGLASGSGDLGANLRRRLIKRAETRPAKSVANMSIAVASRRLRRLAEGSSLGP
jgi:hypothetical protein